LRLLTAVVVAIVAVLAWRLPWFELLEGVAMLTTVALVHAVLVARLRSATDLIPA
jgi:hypothetical protein